MFRKYMLWSMILGLLSLLFFTNSDPKYFAGYAQLLNTENLRVAANKSNNHHESVNTLDLSKYRPTLRD